MKVKNVLISMMIMKVKMSLIKKIDRDIVEINKVLTLGI